MFKKGVDLKKLGLKFYASIAASENIDSSGERIIIEGVNCDSTVKDGAVNFEHGSDQPSQVVGKIIECKKILKESDCETEDHKYFWKKVNKTPYIYIQFFLLTGAIGHRGAEELASLISLNKYLDLEKTRPMIGSSIEGSKLSKKDDGTITACIFRDIALTKRSCNKNCLVEEREAPETIQEFEHSLIDLLKKHEISEEPLRKAEFKLQQPTPSAAHTPSGEFTSSKQSNKANKLLSGQEFKDKIAGKLVTRPVTRPNTQNNVRLSLVKKMKEQKMTKEVYKSLADEAYSHFQKKEELIQAIEIACPDMSDSERLALAKTYAYVELKKSEEKMESLVKYENKEIKQDMTKTIPETSQSEKNKTTADKRLSGVHKPLTFAGKRYEGKSKAGAMAEHAHYNETESARSANLADAKQEHKKVLKEIRNQPKPNLPKSEQNISKGDNESQHGKPGINRPLYEKGVNPTVSVSREYKDNKPVGHYSEKSLAGVRARRGDMEGAKKAAKGILKEIRNQPKPNLPKSEKNMVKSEYGNKRDYPKIDIHHKGQYHASTNWSKNLKEAKQKHLEKNPKHKAEDIKVSYSNPKNKK